MDSTSGTSERPSASRRSNGSTLKLPRLGQEVIIEWGIWGQDERDRLREGAQALGAAVELYLLDPPIEMLYERVRMRATEDPPIELADLRRWSRRFQRPTPEELAGYDHAAVITETL